jgi:uncharacterized membrane protein YtjA (UPF0391 family)
MIMYYYTIGFLFVALVAGLTFAGGLFGIADLGSAAREIARAFFVIFAALFLACLILGVERPLLRRTLKH